MQIDTVTLSENQHAHVLAEVAWQGFEDRIRVHLLDYRAMPRDWDGGGRRAREHGRVLGAIDRVLKRKNVAEVKQSITIPEARQFCLDAIT